MARFVSRLFTALFAAIALAVGLAACGDDGSSDLDPADVLVETLGNDEHVTSGTFDFTLGGSVEGTQSANGEITMSGAFQSDPENPAALPQLELDGSASGDAAGTSVDFDGGLVVTSDNAYVTYQDETYELGASLFNALQLDRRHDGGAHRRSGSSDPVGATGAEGAAETRQPTMHGPDRAGRWQPRGLRRPSMPCRGSTSPTRAPRTSRGPRRSTSTAPSTCRR